MKFSTKTPATERIAVKRLNSSQPKITWLWICFSVIMGLNPVISWAQTSDYTITSDAGPNGSISPVGTTSVSFNESRSYNIAPDACYRIADVLVDGESVGPVSFYTFNDVQANHTISATFTINQYTITASSGDNGSITAAGTATVDCSGRQEYTVTPAACYHIADVLVDGVSVGPVNSYTFSDVQANHTISANFALNQNTITASSGNNGSITPAGTTTVNCGGGQAYTITPAPCYHIAQVSVDGVPREEISGELKKWHRVTITFVGPTLSETEIPNPFLDYRLNVIFTHSSGKSYDVPGYFAADGNAGETSAASGNKWRVHFSPDETGTWTYRVYFRQGTDIAVNDDVNAGTAVLPLNGKIDSFFISPSDKTGRDLRAQGRLKYVGASYLQFAETKEYFRKAGADSPENFMAYEDFDNTPNIGGRRKTWAPHVQDWNTGDITWKGGKGKGIIGAVNYLSEQGMNVFSFLTMNILGDDKNVYPYVTDTDFTRIDVSKVDQWEMVMEHAQKMGMYLHFKMQERENDRLLNGGDLGTQRKLYCRELIARFSHHLALNWNIGEENIQTDQQRKDMAKYIYDHDPYKHNIVLHTYPGEQEQIYRPLLGNASNYTGISIQTGETNVYAETKKWVQASANSGKKWIVANDEQTPGVACDAEYTGNRGTAADNSELIRKEVLWGNFMAGGAGVEYYFSALSGQTDVSCQDFRSRAKSWKYAKYALEFFQNFLPFTELKPISNVSSGWCVGKDAEVYVVYLRTGGSSNITLPPGTYTVKWYNPRKGGDLQNGSVTSLSSGTASIGNPPSEASLDWAVLIRNDAASFESPYQDQAENYSSQSETSGYTFTNVTANHTISAIFAINTYVITASPGLNGSITPAGTTTVDCGGTREYTITAAACYHIADVLVDGVSVGAVSSYTFNDVQANHTISATFAIDQYTITASAGANGSVTPAGATTVNCAGSKTYTMTPAACYGVLDVLVDEISIGAVSSYTFSNVTANRTISAVFTNIAPPNAGTISGSPSVCKGSTTTLSSNGTAGGSWSSSNTAVATVNAGTGVVTGVNAGSAVIKYTVTNSCGPVSATRSITVNPLPNAGILSGSSSVCKGSTTTLTSNGTAGGIWSCSNTAVAAVNSTTGVVTGVAAGSATIKYTVTANGCSASATKSITVQLTPVAGTLSGSSSVCKGATTKFTSSGTAGGSWSSSNIAVATVNVTTGVVTGVAAGTATIKYTVTNSCGSVNVTKSITVKNQIIAITCPSGNPFSRNANSSCKYTVSGSEFNATATSNCSTPKLTYVLSGATVVAASSLNTSLAGKVLNKGTTTVTWTAKDVTSHTVSCSFTVTVKDVNSPVITCKPNATRLISTNSYTVSGTEFNATAKDNCGVSSLIYSLSGATVAAYNSLNKSLAGKIFNTGITTITWKATDAANRISTCKTTVTVTKANASSITASISSPDELKISTLNPNNFSVRVMNNPSATNFKLQVESNSNEAINIRVVDVSGRLIGITRKAFRQQVITIGDGYKAGTYFAEVKQGSNHSIVKLIKMRY